jgi:hypothetical protein
MAQGGFPPAAELPNIQGAVANTTWAKLQPNQSDNTSLRLVHPNAIDNVLKNIQRDPAKQHLLIKIRIFAGKQSPSWAMNLNGAAFQLNDFSCTSVPLPAGCNGGSRSYLVPRWWGPKYQAAYDRFQQALGAAYDGNPVIAEIDSPRCMVVYAEPMVRPYDPWSLTNLLNAGYTVPTDVACLKQEMDSQAISWPHTRVTVSVNPYENIFWKSGVATRSADAAVTKAIIDYCRVKLGAQCMLENAELGRPSATPGDPTYSYLYPMMFRAGLLTSFEVDNPRSTHHRALKLILDLAVAWKANSVEMTNAYLNSQPPSFFAAYNTALINNAPPVLACVSAKPVTLVVPPIAPLGTVIWTSVSAGCTTPSYRYWILPPGGTWTMTQDYGTTAWKWDTTNLPPGTYQIGVWARQKNSLNAYDTYGYETFALGTGRCISAALSFSLSPPQLPGPSVAFTATSNNCTKPRYEFWLMPPGGAWSMKQGYSNNPTWTWNTNNDTVGTYQVGVWVKRSTSRATRDAYYIGTFTLGVV